MYGIQHCFICRPTDPTVSEDAGIKPMTVATLTFTNKITNKSNKSGTCKNELPEERERRLAADSTEEGNEDWRPSEERPRG